MVLKDSVPVDIVSKLRWKMPSLVTLQVHHLSLCDRSISYRKARGVALVTLPSLVQRP